jgi:hypothetical protein
MQNKSDRAATQVLAPKPYEKPTLVKGAVLAAVTAAKNVSGSHAF